MIKFTSFLVLCLVLVCRVQTDGDMESVGSSNTYPFLEQFDNTWQQRWVHSKDNKYNGKFILDKEYGLKAPEPARSYGISTLLDEPVDPKQGLVLQYQLKLGEKLECGGAYLKFLSYEADFSQEKLHDQTPYSVMFGPDKCGTTNKVHLILRHKNPNTQEIEEKHLTKPVFVDSDTDFSNIYTAKLNPQTNSYELLVNGEQKASGSLHEDFTPAINPSKEIDDPEDTKPSEWVEEQQISDPKAQKPEDWDEEAPEYISDSSAKKPEEWDDEEDGEWEAPQIKNPAYKGKWSAPLIPNPAYKGEWKPSKIDNPSYFDDKEPLSNIGKIGGVAIEIWTMQGDINFDNILVSSDLADADKALKELWQPLYNRQKAEKEARDKEAPTEDTKEKTGQALNNMSLRELEQRASGAVKQTVRILDQSLGQLVDKYPQLEPAGVFISQMLNKVDENPIYTLLISIGLSTLSLTSLIFILSATSKGQIKPEDYPEMPIGQKKKHDIATADDKENEVSDKANVKDIPALEKDDELDEVQAKKKRTPRAD